MKKLKNNNDNKDAENSTNQRDQANNSEQETQINPFTPLFGKVPPVIAGREEIITSLCNAFETEAASPELCSIITGVRGSGKTTLLRYLGYCAESAGWIVASTTAKIGMLEDLLEKAKNQAEHLVEKKSKKKLTQIGIGSLASVSWQNVDEENLNWRSKITALLDALEKTNTGILFVVDEINGSLDEMIQLATVFQLLVGEDRKVALLMAGLPYHASSLLLGKTTSFLRRAQQFKLKSIPDYAVMEAFRLTVQEAGKEIDEDALEYAVDAIGGFPYLFQLVGFRAWNASGTSEHLTLKDVKEGTQIAKAELRDRIFDSTIEELSQGDQEFLSAMSKTQEYTLRSDIASKTGRDSSWISRYKKRLLEAGVIEEPRAGKFKFSLPGFAEYLAEYE